MVDSVEEMEALKANGSWVDAVNCQEPQLKEFETIS